MMASNILSKLLPSPSNEQSDFMTAAEARSSMSSARNRQLGIDEENLGEHFEDQDLDNLLAEAVETESTRTSPIFKKRERHMSKPKWMSTGRGSTDDDDDVPESLLLEGGLEASTQPKKSKDRGVSGLPPPVPGPSRERIQAQWDTARARQRLHDDGEDKRPRPSIPFMNIRRPVIQDRKERAMWMWANVQDLDGFLREIYQYYIDRGVWSIILSRVLWLMQTAFIIVFATFLMFCVDYSRIPHEEKLRNVLHDKCLQTRVHGLWSFVLWVCMGLWLYLFVTYAMHIPRLWQLHDFYHHLLDVPDSDIQTISWQLVVSRLMALRDSNIITAQNISAANRRFIGTQSKMKIDAHDVANRLMRRENYLIALFNKDILDLTINLPFLGRRQLFSKTTEMHLALAVMDFVFDDKGHVRPHFLTDRTRSHLVQQLRSRLALTGLISIVFSPIVAIAYIAWNFLRYFTEFQKDPSQIGARSFTRLAEWKFREFNELPHLFDIRRHMALAYSDEYLRQFPKHKTEQLASFVTLITSALLTVLGIATVLDSESFFGFQITDGRTAVFYMTMLSVIWAAARSSGPQEEPTMDPKVALSHVIECTRYCPATWKDRLHTDEVRQEFTTLYQLRLVNLFEEFLSIIVTPFILIYRLPACSERIIDFFREFTINVDGLGNVCSFAVFDFKKGVENIARTRPDQAVDDAGLREDYYATKDAKLMASVMGFQDTYVTNAATTRRFNPNRKQSRFPFEPPPQFDLYNLNGNDTQRQSFMRTPQMRAIQHPSRAEPMHSVLLDPQHQPSMSAVRSPAQNPQTRSRAPRQAFGGLDESPEIRAREMTTSRIIEEDSNLGDSWRTTRAAEGDEDDDARELEDQRPGVLGLLYQFQKKQIEGRAPGAAAL